MEKGRTCLPEIVGWGSAGQREGGRGRGGEGRWWLGPPPQTQQGSYEWGGNGGGMSFVQSSLVVDGVVGYKERNKKRDGQQGVARATALEPAVQM